jgi:hypothetical protein
MKQSKQVLRCAFSASKRYLGFIAALLMVVVLVLTGRPVAAAAGGETKSAGGLTVYFGIVPAEIVKGPGPHSAERPMHGRIPHGPHEHHLVVAVFDSASNARIEDATVTAKVSGLGLSGPQRTLEPMKIGDSVTYGAYFNLATDLYTIKVTAQRPGAQPVVLDFKYDHRRP